ncbi:aldose 1-epimerase family protein [Aquimarina agarilytica]|uniref:aldose 1-epimerase family protein n=1 Tax=Aquimarina agarilytica TaxID=1087449 RepID=UPI0002885B62|nr:aldose 1-epimerase family protein [Aquimarina agarilytica]
MTSIENEYLKITIKNTGAELSSLYNKKSNTELLWQGDATFWSGQAPILFPIVGGLKENTHIHNNTKYQLNRHGFARRSKDWKIEQKNKSCIQCTLTANEATLNVYPFDFTLVVTYTINKNNLSIEHNVTNNGKKTMPFSVGAHPAFNCLSDAGSTYNDYSLKFETTEIAHRHFINKDGLFNDQTELTLNNTDTLQLSEDLFNNDALVFKNLKSKKVSLFKASKKILSLSFKDFPFLGIWAAPKAPFVCIEPWIGHADHIDTNQDLFSKEGSKSLASNETFSVAYQITTA